jgi:predicted Fe-Mo cluster-binding NifX family protein
MKIAITSSDGVNIDLHFGKGNSIYIYDFDGEDTKFIEHRTVEINLNEKHQWQKVLASILDCDVVFAVQFGLKSSFGIEEAGLIKIEEHGAIDDALQHFVNHYKLMKKV